MLYPVILAGGSGSRLWPLSREQLPKQYLALLDKDSLFKQTINRLAAFPEIQPPLFVCNEAHQFLLQDHLNEIMLESQQSDWLDNHQLIFEPCARNTAPAIALAAMRALELESDPVLWVCPADHYLPYSIKLKDAVDRALNIVQGDDLASEISDHESEHYKDILVTFGIKPTHPATGYGYIQCDGAEGGLVGQFVEKPCANTAKIYHESGNYYWNSGMFLFRASSYLNVLKQHAPEILTHCEQAFMQGRQAANVLFIDHSAFKQCPSNSIDYAVMEKTGQAMMIPLNTHWSDIGSWHSLWQQSEKDEQHNVQLGDVVCLNVKNSYISSDSRLLVAMGLEDCVIVETADAVFVGKREQEAELKQAVSELKAQGRKEVIEKPLVHRPWGQYETTLSGERFLVKRITVNPGASLSLQKHHHRSEHWVVVSGTAHVTKGDKTFTLYEDQSTYIPSGVMHRLSNPGKIPLEIIEVQSGSYLGEDDIVRLEDIYGRVAEAIET